MEVLRKLILPQSQVSMQLLVHHVMTLLIKLNELLGSIACNQEAA